MALGLGLAKLDPIPVEARNDGGVLVLPPDLLMPLVTPKHPALRARNDFALVDLSQQCFRASANGEERDFVGSFQNIEDLITLPGFGAFEKGAEEVVVKDQPVNQRLLQ